MSLRASINPDRTPAYAGIPVCATVTVANTAELVDAFEIRVLGVDRSWIQTSRRTPRSRAVKALSRRY